MLTDVDAAKVVTQTPAVHTVSTGQQVVLSCNIERNAYFDVSWYKQVPGEAPQLVLNGYTSPKQFGTGFSSDRFDCKASSDTDFQLIIKRAETGDSAVYYLKTYDTSTYEHLSQ